jgi:hypothetical protein
MIRITPLAVLPLFALALSTSASAQQFTPGDRVIYQESFSAPRDTVMKRLRNVHPRVSLARHGNTPGLHARTPASFEIILPEQLPARYTVEFDIYIAGQNHVAVTTLGANGADQGTLLCGPHTLSVFSGEGDDETVSLDEISGLGGTTEARVNHCAFSVDGDRVHAWVNGIHAADEQATGLGRGNRLRVHFAGVEDPTLLDQNIPVWLSNIRIAAVTGR